MLSRILNSKTNTITFAAGLLSLSALFSRILGLFRNNLIANLLPQDQADIYFAAFRIPDFVYGVLITGGIVAAFLPVFSEFFKKSREQARVLVANTFFVFLAALIFISAVLALFTPQLIKFIVPGFAEEQKILAVSLTRIMFISPVLLGISAIFSGILHYFSLFLATALAPIFYNIGIIAGILFFRPLWGLKGLAFGVILGAFAYLAVQIPPVLKMGYLSRFSFKLNYPGLKKIFKLALPRVLSSAAYHINLIVITAIASTLTSGSIKLFNLSNDLQSVPIGLLAIPLATAAFPILTRHFANNKKQDFSKSFSAIFSQILFLIVPLTVLIFLLRAQIVRLIYGTQILGNGYFGWVETRLTAASLGIFSLSLFAACLMPLLCRAFFAFHDTKTPVKIAIVAMVLNIILCYFFVWCLGFPNFLQKVAVNFLKLRNIRELSFVGLPLAFSISTIIQFFMLCLFLRRKITVLNFKQSYQSLSKILIAALFMAVLTYLALQIFSLFLDTYQVSSLFLQSAAAAIAGISAFVFASFLLKIPELKTICLSLSFSRFRK